MNKKKFIDILFWADINPLKRGSFEDFICGLATECNKRNININFLFGSKISKAVEKVFHDNQVSYILLPDHDISSVFALAKILKKNKPKMIHFHFIGPGSPLVPIALLLGVKRIIMTDHTSRLVNNVTTDSNALLSYAKRLKRRIWVNMVDKYIAVSDYVALQLQDHAGVPAEKITTIFNGILLERFDVKDVAKEKLRVELFGKNSRRKIICYVGQLSEEKGVLCLLAAIRCLSAIRDDFVLIVAGAGPLAALIADNEVIDGKKRIFFLKYRDDVEKILSISDLLVCPSLWEEAFGLVLAEAAAAGVPCVASRVGGIPEVAIDGQTAVLFEPGDIDNLTEVLNTLLADDEKRKTLSINSKIHAMRHFNLSDVVARTLDVYNAYL